MDLAPLGNTKSKPWTGLQPAMSSTEEAHIVQNMQQHKTWQRQYNTVEFWKDS